MKNIKVIMSNHYRIYIRGKHSGGKVWWIQDNKTGDRESLRTKNKQDALAILLLRNRPSELASHHAQISDPNDKLTGVSRQVVTEMELALSGSEIIKTTVADEAYWPSLAWNVKLSSPS
jgi:hypothetical protein